ncbi:MAG: DUF1801 domain-containing protein [Cyclobacteriaceae bacterium]|nr:DUF1801 domain-containing protein [Cyclobacteriaceae bacterium]
MDEIDNYILKFPDNVQDILRKRRSIIKTVAPDAEELMAYGMPAYKIKKRPHLKSGCNEPTELRDIATFR